MIRPPDRLTPPGPDIVMHTLFWSLPLFPRSRRLLRRVLLSARYNHLDCVVEHDRSWFFRMTVLRVTGTSENVARFRRSMDRLLPLVVRWGSW